MSKVKITDIAERSGVSLTTVSRYFNHPELLSKETQDKIQSAIKELNYQQDNLSNRSIEFSRCHFPTPSFKFLYRIVESTHSAQ